MTSCSNIYGPHIFLAAKSHNSSDISNCMELHTSSTSNHRNPFSNATNASHWKDTSTLTLSFVASIWIKSSLSSCLPRWSHFITSEYLRFSQCFQHLKNLLPALDNLKYQFVLWLFKYRVFSPTLLHLHHFRIF